MITRREFNLKTVRGALAIPFAKLLKLERDSSETSSSASAQAPDSSAGDFTPFGYLDNPYHSWNLHRSGILRSLAGIGFGLYFPAGPGGYFDERKNGIYQSFLRLGFSIGARCLWNPEDFRDGELNASHHSKNVLTYHVRADGLDTSCSFFQVSEDALAARIDFEKVPAAGGVRLIVAHEYQLGNAKWWGGDGIAAAYDAHADGWITRSFAAGTVFSVAADAVTQFHVAGADWTANLLRPTRSTDEFTAYGTAPVRTTLLYDITPAVRSRGLTVYMARGVNRAVALSQLRKGRESARRALDEKLADDAKFWRNAPRLAGDWPAHWKNGWVYDFETLRMIVRRPMGIYDHRWDAMQIQAPRNVLAETSIDMFALSYADPETAKSVFLGQFLDALAPNIPCAREDRVMNMVAADGSECGTSISWCYPFHCARSIYERTGDNGWLAALYPHLSSLLRWTLANRSDKEEFIIAKCSWESGMDASRRFLIQEPTGGETTEFIRLVELQSAASQAAAVLAEFARVLGKGADEAQWNHLREVYGTKTQQLWNGRDWFNDFDTRTMSPIRSVARDAGQVGPIFCSVTTPEQTAAMLSTLRDFYESSRDGKAGEDDPMIWSSLMLPYIESLWAAQEFELLADVVYLIAERIYPSMDRRKTSADAAGNRARLGWPGVSCELWGQSGARGGEGYGWGAVLPAHIIRNIVGLRETPEANRLLLSPSLPRAFMIPARTYALRNLTLRSRAFAVQYAVRAADAIDVTGSWPAGQIQVQDVATGTTVGHGVNEFSFNARNGHLYSVIAGS